MSTFKKIGSIVDNTNTSYSMYYANEVANTPALAFVFEGWAELLKNNMAFPRVHFGNKDSVVWIENDAGEIVALILYAIRKDEDDCWILLTYTVPSYRGRGINPKLLDVVKEIVIDTNDEDPKINLIGGTLILNQDLLNLLNTTSRSYNDRQIGRNALIKITQNKQTQNPL